MCYKPKQKHTGNTLLAKFPDLIFESLGSSDFKCVPYDRILRAYRLYRYSTERKLGYGTLNSVFHGVYLIQFWNLRNKLTLKQRTKSIMVNQGAQNRK